MKVGSSGRKSKKIHCSNKPGNVFYDEEICKTKKKKKMK